MPIYEYRCECGKTFDNIRPMSECSKPSICPECGKAAERKMSNSYYRVAELFQVIDSNGTVVKSKQVLENNPDWNDHADEQKKEPTTRVPALVRSRSGQVFYDRIAGYYDLPQ